MSTSVSSTRHPAERAWLPVLRLALRMRGDRELPAFFASHREMNPVQAYVFAAYYYLTSLIFLGACMLPGLAILPFSALFAWPILLITHIALLHAVTIVTGWMARMAKPILGLVRMNSMGVQCAVFLGGLTLAAIPMAGVGGFTALTAWVWLGFCAVNLMAGLILLLVE